MTTIYEADVLTLSGHVFDTLEVGGDDGSLPPLEMGPDTARQELEQLALDNYGKHVHIGLVRVKGTTG